jgi:hypothetical protein
MPSLEDQIQDEFTQGQGANIPVALPKNLKTEDDTAFRSRVAGLSFLIKPDKADATLNQTVRFVPFYEKFQGDDVKVGYLKTNLTDVIELAKADPNVEEISLDEFEKATTGKGVRPAGY